MIPIRGDKGMNVSKKSLENLRNFLNDNMHYIHLMRRELKIIQINSLHEVKIKGKITYYGIMGKFYDYSHTHNKQGDFYGEGFEQWEYPGSINIKKEGMVVFLRKKKIEQIKEKIHE